MYTTAFGESHPAEARDFLGWIDANGHKLKPPVANTLMYGKGSQFKVMIVGGPNTRTDFHVNPTEEWFYQLRGSMTLTVIDGNIKKNITIRAGEQFLLPAFTPHSPQRVADSVGLVLELERPPGATDSLRWYCRAPGCGAITHQDSFACSDLGTQLVGVIQDYYGSEDKRTCKRCGVVDQPPKQAQSAKANDTSNATEGESEQKAAAEAAAVATAAGEAAAATAALAAGAGGLPASDSVSFVSIVAPYPDVNTGAASAPVYAGAADSEHSGSAPARVRVSSDLAAPVINTVTHPAPCSLMGWIEDNKHELLPPVCNKLLHSNGTQFKVMVVGGPNRRTDYHVNPTEEWFYQLKGDMQLDIVDAGAFKSVPIPQGHCFLLPGNVPHSPQRFADTLGLVIEVSRAIPNPFAAKPVCATAVNAGFVSSGVSANANVACASSEHAAATGPVKDALMYYCRTPGCLGGIGGPGDFTGTTVTVAPTVTGEQPTGTASTAALWRREFDCQDLGRQVKEGIVSYYGDEEGRTCPRCGVTDQRPTPAT